jgi:hypothetical protein
VVGQSEDKGGSAILVLQPMKSATADLGSHKGKGMCLLEPGQDKVLGTL